MTGPQRDGRPSESEGLKQDRLRRQLAELRGLWQGEYWITLADGIWAASPHRARHVVLTADTAGELRGKIRADYARRRPESSSGP